jgi:hypothetical protein
MRAPLVDVWRILVLAACGAILTIGGLAFLAVEIVTGNATLFGVVILIYGAGISLLLGALSRWLASRTRAAALQPQL